MFAPRLGAHLAWETRVGAADASRCEAGEKATSVFVYAPPNPYRCCACLGVHLDVMRSHAAKVLPLTECCGVAVLMRRCIV